MSFDVKDAEYIGDYKIKFAFEDGSKGVVDFASYINRGGEFSKFKDIEFFRKFHINRELGVLCWGDSLDIAPETLYSLATGKPLPNWMQTDEKVTQAG